MVETYNGNRQINGQVNGQKASYKKDLEDILYITDEQGVRHKIEAIEGWRIMEIIRAHGFNIAGLCEGACACATCHVHIATDWLSRLHCPRDDEEDILDTLPLVSSQSRLSCQIIYSPALSGLELRLIGNA